VIRWTGAMDAPDLTSRRSPSVTDPADQADVGATGARRPAQPVAPVRHHRSGDRREAYLPAEQASSSPKARVPAPNVHPRRSSDPQEPAPQGAAPSVGLIDRITSRATFRSFTRSRDRAGTPWFTVVRSDGPPDPPAVGAGMAFAIPRRVGTAVQRNRVRRQLRSAARHRYLQRGGPAGWFLVVVRPGAPDASYSDLAGALDAALDKFERNDQ
jgi:ribonuclease P protein component